MSFSVSVNVRVQSDILLVFRNICWYFELFLTRSPVMIEKGKSTSFHIPPAFNSTRKVNSTEVYHNLCHDMMMLIPGKVHKTQFTCFLTITFS